MAIKRTKNKKAKIKTRGAPTKREGDKKGSDGLTKDQQQQLKGLAVERGTSVANLKRQAIQWFLDAIEQGKANSLLELAEDLEVDQR